MNLQEFIEQTKKDLDLLSQDFSDIQKRLKYPSKMEYYEWLELFVAYAWLGPEFIHLKQEEEK